MWVNFIHAIPFASAVFAAISNQWTARSSAVWSCCKPPSNRDTGHESTIWLMVCFCPQLQDSDVDRPHWCKSAGQVPRPVRKRFSIDQVCHGRSKPGCRIVGSGTKDWLTTGADVQTSLHWAFMSTGVMSDDQNATDHYTSPASIRIVFYSINYRSCHWCCCFINIKAVDSVADSWMMS